MTHEDAKKLKNGQYIQVKVSKYGKWRDALVIEYDPDYGIYAHYMEYQGNIYGVQHFFDLDEVRLPKGSGKK